MIATFHTENRRRIAHSLQGGFVVLTAYTSMQRGNDAAFSFEQEANFWWLTGIEVADWWLIIDGTRGKSWLVSPVVSQSHEIFDGSLAAEEAMRVSGVDAVMTRDEANDMLRQAAKHHSVVYTLGDMPHQEHLNFTLNPAVKKMYDMLHRTFSTVQDCRKELANLRAIKQPEEIATMKQAINMTIDGFLAVKKLLPSAKYEYELEAEFTHLFRSRGAAGHAYDPIVASGKNACTLHYGQNDTRLKKRELVLLDVGARYGGYAADITRTYANGEPTKRQKVVHAELAAAQVAIIALLKPGLLVSEYHAEVERIMKSALISLSLMKSPGDDAAYHRYFPHAISHGLGVDVHDSLGVPRRLEPGMVLTVEPGIYIPDESIGLRIEDDILITESGRQNLTSRLSTDL